MAVEKLVHGEYSSQYFKVFWEALEQETEGVPSRLSSL